jgi:hypothetical protein
MNETNIVALHDQIPQISRPSPSFLPARLRSGRHRSALFFFFFFFFRPLYQKDDDATEKRENESFS